MINKLKKLFYFPIAYYFRFFATIQLNIWKPRIFLITGSSGKTTLLHLIESQLKEHAKYSYKANSSFGIPFDILGLKRETLKVEEWFFLFLLTPFKAFKRGFLEKLYIVEADTDRPDEGKFIAEFLKPEICIWLNVSRTHSVNFEDLVKQKKFDTVEQAIAFDFGYYVENTQKLVVVNGDSELISSQLKRAKTPIIKVSKKDMQDYKIFKDHTQFKIKDQIFSLPYLLPEDTFYSLYMCLALVDYLGLKPDLSFTKLQLPPGRSSIFKGVKNTTIIDSSYNASLSSMTALIKMFDQIPEKNKWIVLSDMVEQGSLEKEEHERLAKVISENRFDRIVLMGPRMTKYVYPNVKGKIPAKTTLVAFESPKEVLNYLLQNLEGGETILFKGARFLEGVIEHLLTNKSAIEKLCRREKVWQERRKKWGL